jgi:hypothetical protein
MSPQLSARIRKYVAAMSPGISGHHGHDATFAVARVLVHSFALPIEEAWPILREYSEERCQPPWSETELRHKLEDACNLSRPSKPKGHLLGMAAERPPVPNGKVSKWLEL